MSISSEDLLSVQPTELKFPFEYGAQSSSSMQLTNKTGESVAFKTLSTYPKKFCARPNQGIVLPGTTCDVTVSMDAQTEESQGMECEDTFLVRSIIAPKGVTGKDITPEMFEKTSGKFVDEVMLTAIFVPPNVQVLKGLEEGHSCWASGLGTCYNDAINLHGLRRRKLHGLQQ